MELGTFAPRAREEYIGDSLPAKEAADRPLIVLVREHKTGVKTKFNQDASNAKTYKPEGADAVTVDVADVATDQVYIDVLWLNGAVVDNLAPYVGQHVPVKLIWAAPAGGGNSYITVSPLAGDELAKAHQWAAANPTRFDTERAQRKANADSHTQQTAAPAAPAVAPLQPIQTPAATPPPAPAQAAASSGALDPNDPAVAALIAQLNAQQAPAAS